MRVALASFAVVIVIGISVSAWLIFSYFEAVPRDVGLADRVEVVKSDRTLTLYAQDEVLATYRVALGSNATGHKLQEGDSRTPEGEYLLDWRNRKSQFYKSIHISYPSDADIARARAAGVSPGGDIMIHGQPNGYGFLSPFLQVLDWTDGCIAVSDKHMEEIWRAVPDGTPIEIKP